jgi:hypothetical protein
MSDIGISPEDRERLAKTKFGEWFDEFWDKKFSEAFEKSLADARKPHQGQPMQPPATPEQPLPPQQRPQRKRSLLEECFSQTFGF